MEIILIFMTLLSMAFGFNDNNWIPFIIMIIIWIILYIIYLCHLDIKQKELDREPKKDGNSNVGLRGTFNNIKSEEIEKPIKILPDLSNIKVDLNHNIQNNNNYDFNTNVDLNIENKKEDLKYKPKEKILVKRKEVREYMYNQNRHGNNSDILIPKTRHKDRKEVYYEMDKSFKHK